MSQEVRITIWLKMGITFFGNIAHPKNIFGSFKTYNVYFEYLQTSFLIQIVYCCLTFQSNYLKLC